MKKPVNYLVVALILSVLLLLHAVATPHKITFLDKSFSTVMTYKVENPENFKNASSLFMNHAFVFDKVAGIVVDEDTHRFVINALIDLRCVDAKKVVWDGKDAIHIVLSSSDISSGRVSIDEVDKCAKWFEKTLPSKMLREILEQKEYDLRKTNNAIEFKKVLEERKH